MCKEKLEKEREFGMTFFLDFIKIFEINWGKKNEKK